MKYLKSKLGIGKRIVMPLVVIISLTLFSFQSKRSEDTVLKLMPDGNYLIIDGSKIAVEDQDFLIASTQEFKGQSSWITIRVIKSSFVKNVFESVIYKIEHDCGCDKKDSGNPEPEMDETLQEIISKYN
ncbi:hypothetical protein ABS768_01785 [Flavobacterium sp. ST-75]|uniref:Uncharacterized protein n=1 Tax=Flavobacterium rhizophilum TaxID=3163296 RepID=A0ABW8Y8D3_9FLAO